MPRGDVVRSALTLPIVLGTGLYLLGREQAIYAVLAALVVVLGERTGTTGQRMFKAGFALLTGTVAMWLGPQTADNGLTPLLVVMAFSGASGLLSSFGIAGSFAGMQMLVQMSIAGGLALDVPTSTKLLSYMSGGCAALVGILIQDFLERGRDRYKEALLLAADSMQDCINQAGNLSPEVIEKIRRMDSNLSAAEYLIRNARPLSRPVLKQIEGYLVVLSNGSLLSADIVEGTRQECLLASRIEEFRRSAQSGLDSGSTPATRPLSHLTIIGQFSDALFDEDTWRFTARLVICMAVAELVRQNDPLGHSYWIPLTTALVLKPDLASVFSRSLQRGIGTAIGMILGFAVILVVPGPILLLPLALLAAVVPYTVRRSYAWFSVVVTPMVFILLDFVSPTTPEVLLQRLVNTSIACSIVLIVGYVMWPGTWFPSAHAHIARICRALGNLIESPRAHDELTWAQDRLAISQDIARLRLRGDLTDSEPEVMRSRGHYWHETLAALETVMLEATRSSRSIDRKDAILCWHALHTLSSRTLLGGKRYRDASHPSLPATPLGHAISALRSSLLSKVSTTTKRARRGRAQ